jgi:hypothetical protein
VWLIYRNNNPLGVCFIKQQAKRFISDHQAGKFRVVNPIYSNEGPNIPLEDIDDPKRSWSYWEDTPNKIRRLKLA